MFRRLMLWLGFEPCWCIWVVITPDEQCHKVSLVFRVRPWATEEDVNVCRAAILTAIRLHLNGCHEGKITTLRDGEE